MESKIPDLQPPQSPPPRLPKRISTAPKPTMSYRSANPFRVVGEVTVWQGPPAEQVAAMKVHLACLKDAGIESLNA